MVEDLTMSRRSLETAESSGQDELRPPDGRDPRCTPGAYRAVVTFGERAPITTSYPVDL